MKKIILIIMTLCFPVLLGFSQTNQSGQNKKTALIIIDIQNAYFEGGSLPLVGPDQASENARLILDRFRSDSLLIIHIQHISTKSSTTSMLQKTKNQEIHDNVKPLGQEKVIEKHYPNGFKETELLDYLKSNQITDLVICGMMTHMCVDATVRAAKDFGFNVVLIGDACATKDMEINGQLVKAEEVQKSFLAALNSYYATVQTTKHYLDKK